MANLQTQYAGIHIPAGCEVLVGDSVESLIDLGVIPEETDSKIDITYEVSTVQGSKAETVIRQVRKMVAKGSTALYQVNLEKINSLLGGLMKITKGTGSAVSGATQTIKSPVKQVLYILNGQNQSGAAPTITTVKQGSTTLAVDTGYVLAKDSNGAWGLMFPGITASTDITVTYGYTPAAYTKATMGDASAAISSKVIRFKKTVGGKLFQVTLYSANMNNGLSLSFPSSSADKPVSIPVEIEGSLDTTRAEGDQLLEIIDEIGV